MASKATTTPKDTYKVGRSAKTGQFVPVATAKAKPSTHVVETMKKPDWMR
jgi:hypothetical protein